METFDWKKLGIKVLWSFVFIVISGILSVVANEPKLLLLVPLLTAVQNVIKHREKLW